uniref:Uncharacterized protein n=1 Tax=Rhizophora mucronata TaxID=61149 RepID=A0A2P2KCP4_RHIMU
MIIVQNSGICISVNLESNTNHRSLLNIDFRVFLTFLEVLRRTAFSFRSKLHPLAASRRFSCVIA